LCLRCSHFVFHKHSRSFIKCSTNGLWPSFHLKNTVEYFQTEQHKKKPDSKQEKLPLFTAEGHAVTFAFTVHLRWLIQSEPKMAAANFFHPSSWMITFDGWAVYTVHF
jgi:hypothetical protein